MAQSHSASRAARATTEGAPRAPGPALYALVRLFLGVHRDPTAGLTKLWKRYGDVVRIPYAGVHFLVHPEAVRRVLVEERDGFSKRTRDYEAMKPVLGEGLLTSDGPLWQRQRRAIQPAFQHSELVPLVDIVTRETEGSLGAWSAAAARGEAIDIAEEMARLTLAIVGKAILGVSLDTGLDELGPAVTLLNRHMAEDATRPFEIPHWFPTPRNRRFAAARRTVEREVVERARRGPLATEGLRLVEMLVGARDPETGEPMDEVQVRDEIVTLMAAGHETTANALAWTLYCVSQRPELAEALRAEVDSVLAGRAPTLRDLPSLSLAKRVLQESMRLYPPAWGLARRAERDDVIGGYHIPRGSTIRVLIYLLHRHPEFWEDPERFDPDRFLPERSANRHRFAYLPFGAGPRVCIGRDFAMLEVHLIFAMVLSRYRVTLVPEPPVELEPIITLRPRRGIWMRLDER